MRKFKNQADEYIYKTLGFDPDRIPTPQGSLDIYVKEKGKIIYKDCGPNQIMTWAKVPMAYLLSGYTYSSFGEHTGYLDDQGQTKEIAPFTALQSYYVDSTNGIDNPPAESTTETFGCPWRYQTGNIDATANGKNFPYGVYSRLVFNDTESWTGGSNPDSSHTMTPGDNVYSFFITKFLFGLGGIPGSSIDSDQKTLNSALDINNDPAPFVAVDREPGFHINVNATDGSPCDNRSIFSITLPDLTYGATGTGTSYPYDGVTINEVGLYSSAGLVLDPGGPGENAYMETGILLAKRYFNGIKKEQSVSFTFVWSIYF